MGFLVSSSENQDFSTRQLMNLSNLVITVPELLFKPSDAGIDCGGVHEGIIESISKLPAETARDLLKNVWICGGLAKTPGLLERLRIELRMMVDYDVRVFKVNE
jgi:actin-related protein 6